MFMPALSSMYIPADSESSPDAIASFDQSSSLISPFATFSLSTIAWEHRILFAHCSFDISKLNTTTGVFALTAAYVAIFKANAVLPIAGLAAISTKSDLWNPAVLLSKSINPDATPVMCCFWLYNCSNSVNESTKISLIEL